MRCIAMLPRTCRRVRIGWQCLASHSLLPLEHDKGGAESLVRQREGSAYASRSGADDARVFIFCIRHFYAEGEKKSDACKSPHLARLCTRLIRLRVGAKPAR